MAVVYFTGNASTGSGSLVEAVKNAQPGDVIRPDETVFERGSTIEIVLAATLTVDKNLTLDGGPFRVRLNGGARRCASVAANVTATFAGIDFVGGDAKTSNGGGLNGVSTTNVTCLRCGFYGCSAVNGGGAYLTGVSALRDCVVVGCRATTSGGGVYVSKTSTINGSTVAGCVSSGAGAGVRVANGTLDASNSILCGAAFPTGATTRGCVVDVASSQIGFVASPPDDLTVENWNANAWQNWDLRLLDDKSPNPSPYRDAGDVDAMTQYDVQGNFRGRETNGVATCSPGAYETIQADLFWVGVDATGATIETPSFLNADGWSTSRFAETSGDAAPQAGKTLFVDGEVAFVDVLSTVKDAPSTQFGLFLGGGANVGFPSTTVYLSVLQSGAASTFTFSSIRPNKALFGDWSRLAGSFAALPQYDVGSQVYIQTAHLYAYAQPAATYGTLTIYAQTSSSLRLGGAYRCDAFRVRTSGTTGQPCAVTSPGTSVSARVVEWGAASSAFAERLTSEPVTLILHGAASVAVPDGAPESWADSFAVDVSEATSATLNLNGQTVYGAAPTAAVALTGSAKVDARGLTSQALTLNADATLSVDGGIVSVGALTVADGANVAFSSATANAGTETPAATHANAATAGVSVDAVLTARDSATVGAATFTGNGYFATPPGTDLNAATFETCVRRVDFGANVETFAATATGPKTARLEWSASDATRTVCVERENAASPNGWEVVAITPTAEASPLEVALNGKERFRIFDGATFTVDSAWFPTGLFYQYKARVVARRLAKTSWNVRTQVVMAGEVCYRNEGARFLAQIQDESVGAFLAPSDVKSITATVYRICDYLGRAWSPVAGWENVAVPLDALLETPLPDDDWRTASESDPGPNFVWTPEIGDAPIFPDYGSYATQVKFELVGGGTVVATFESTAE